MVSKIVKSGDIVSVNYEGRFEDGEVFDSSSHGDHSHPLEFQVGSGQVIKGFDNAVLGMKEGEEKEFSVEPSEGYGEVSEDAFKELPRKALPAGQEPKEGMMLVMSTPDGHRFPAKISKVSKDNVTLDLNHPLAGKKLIFKITLSAINPEKSLDEHHHH